MKTKFIEGTNQQYSIREDGVVFRHYTHKYDINTKTFNKILLDNVIAKQQHVSNGCITVFIGKQFNTAMSINKLLRSHFGFIFCTKCKNKVEDITEGVKPKRLCNNCKRIPKKRISKSISNRIFLTEEERKINIKKSREKWKLNNPEKLEKHIVHQRKIKTEKLPKYEVASRINIPTSLLTDEFYENYKATLLVKRKLAEKLNCSITKFN
jgi:hypothetical protein